MNWRLAFLIVLVFIFGGGVLSRLFSLQILQYDYYSALAQGQHQFYKTLFPQRGEILLTDLSPATSFQDKYYPLAVNKDFQQAYIVPKEIKTEEKQGLAEKIAAILQLDKAMVLDRINKQDDPYEPLKHKINSETADQIKNLAVRGLGLTSETWRYYPNQSLASHLTGFVNTQEGGQYGLEAYYEEELKGEAGSLVGEKDISGYGIPFRTEKLEAAHDGKKLVLTIDRNIQFRAERELEEAVKKWEAEAGTMIVMDPKTGAILALANWPKFNPNEYSQVEDINVFLNSAIQKTYEPGSVFKPITMAVGLESGKISPQTTYQDNGEVRVGGSVISNVDGKAYGIQTMTQVLEKSLNTGAVFIQQKIGADIFRKYIQGFDFDKPTGVDLSGEVGGDISNVFTNRDINLATISFGQGISMTPLRLLTAISAVANEGKMMKPYLVQKTIDAEGDETITSPQFIDQVISESTAQELTKMMVSVVENGFGKEAEVEGYSIAGKTGTAQVPDLENGGYSEEETIHTFVGFAPAFDARFAVLIKLDKPRGIRFASSSVAPIFKRMAEYLFNYLEIPPQ